MCGPVDAQDATQDALLAVVRGLPRFDGRSSFTTWLHRVTTNACLDELRRRSRRPTIARAVGGPAGDGEHPSPLDPPDEGPQADDRVPDRLTIDDALRALPEEFRAAVVLRDHLDLDYAEIAEVLGIAPGTVRSRIARGRARLADLLGDEAPVARRPQPRNPGPPDDVEGGVP